MEAQNAAPSPGKRTSRSPIPSGHVRTAWRRLFADKAARWIVTGGGLTIIASILGILLFIVIEIWPLVRGARVDVAADIRVAGTSEAVLSDEYKTLVATLSSDGRVRVARVDDGEVVLDESIVGEGTPEPAELHGIVGAPGQQLFTAATAGGEVLAVPMRWEVSFDEDRRVITPRLSAPVKFEIDPAGAPVGAYAARVDDEGAATAVAQIADGTLVVLRREVEENLFTGEISETWSRFETDVPRRLSALVLDQDQRNVYAGAESGELHWWRLDDGEPGDLVATSPGAAVTALSLLIGDRSLVVGRDDGSLGIWFVVRQEDESFDLEPVREFPPHPGSIRHLAPSLRDKGFLALCDQGKIGLYYSTSHRTLWTGESGVPDPASLFITPKADGALIGGAGTVALLDIANPHPEVGMTALFGKVWYEGHSEPAYTWQSSGATDDFEPKLSLTPLMVGTLKGTIYSLFLAIPLGVLGAMYTSQFMHSSLKRYVKPTVEIMAALPSVVLGFLAGLWLAPRIEKIFPSLVLMLVVLPILVLVAGLLWRALPRALRNRFPVGTEAILYIGVIAIGIWGCLELTRPFEALAFGGSFQEWLLRSTGLRYDQRNAIVVGLAMGFAVIPIIFSIAEDAFSNVPRNLVAGSLALGANRWQTVTRVVLPTASPGIFSAIMIGFGRAVGETMIVLMATGNTPVMDWNPFNGFRTLSANIAVEIPEAPHGGTLYRALFLAALLLFVITFIINTVAELVRQRLRRRYAEL